MMNARLVKVSPMVSARTGDAVKNQYVINMPGMYLFQSYNSRIALYDYDTEKLILGHDWDYSTTTSKYLAQFLRDYCPRIYAKINTGRSLKDSINKAIAAGLIEYDSNM